jgi:hypothetical protein
MASRIKRVTDIINQYFFHPMGYRMIKVMPSKVYYDQDGLFSSHNCEFMNDSKFVDAYQRGVKACEGDYLFHWRVHVALWVASHAVNLFGSFVECGVNRGFLSSAIMKYFNWNSLNKQFFLFDTFCGLDEALVSEEEKALGRLEVFGARYNECYEKVLENFKEFKNVTLVRGSVPATLTQVEIPAVCFLSIDMNCAEPEIAAVNYFWPKIVQHGVILLDDYAYNGYAPQKTAFDHFAAEKKVEILSLPTGQGLIIKP